MAVKLSLALVLPLIPILAVACIAKGDGTPKDAREFAVLLVTKAQEGDWKTLRRLLVDEFQEYDENALRRGLSSGGSLSDTLWHSFRDPNQWQDEGSSEFTIVRVIKAPVLALVLRQGSGGGWRLDPGSYALVLARVFQKGLDINEVVPRNYRRQFQTNADKLQVVRRFRDDIININLKGETVEVSWAVMLTRASEAQVPLARLSWRAGNKGGPARVVWTTAKITESTLVFPGPGIGDGGASYRYLVTLSLEGVPEAEAVELEVKDIVMDSMSFSVGYSFDPKSP